MPNFSPLLYTTTGDTCFLDELDLKPEQLAEIDGARKEIRIVLKADLPKVLREKGLEGEICEPRFYIQGSRAYKTLNSPCITPPQQSDIDDGVYLPLSVMREKSSPKLAIDLFFEAVVDVLDPMCTDKDWQTEIKAPSEQMGLIELNYMYVNYTRIPLPTDTNTHTGAARIFVKEHGEDLIMEGTYFTDRKWTEGLNTAGTITFTRSKVAASKDLADGKV